MDYVNSSQDQGIAIHHSSYMSIGHTTYDIYLRNSAIQITSVGLTQIRSNDCCFLAAVVVGLERRTYTVGEEDGQVELWVN